MSFRSLSFLLFGGVIVAAALLQLGPVILATLFSYMVLHFTHHQLAGRVRRFYARTASVTIFAATAVGVFWAVWYFLRQTLSTVPKIAMTAVPRIVELGEQFGLNLPFDNLSELRQVAMDALRENVVQITTTGGLLTKGVFHVIIGIFVAVLFFLNEQPQEYKTNLYDAIRKEFNLRIRTFLTSFEKVLGAQVIISLINTGVTTLFLLYMELPYIHFLVPATFLLGILPLIGNILSNTLIVGTALAISTRDAALALAFLVFIHKLEYFLNSKIVGSSINAPMWQTLLGILIGERVLGVTGIILAPAILHYLREEMQDIQIKSPELPKL